MEKSSSASVGALKIKDAARYIGGVSTTTIRRLIKHGLIKPNRALQHILISISELDRLLADRQGHSAAGCEQLRANAELRACLAYSQGANLHKKNAA